jgi:simple sugar transport system permease protein
VKGLRQIGTARLLTAGVAGVVALLASGALVALAGISPLKAYEAIWTGGLDGTIAIGTTCVMMLPLLFVGLAFAVPFRAGLYNLGIEGQLYLGALASTVVALYLHAPTVVVLPVAILAGMAAGALWALVPAILKLKRGVDEIIASVFLSYVAINFVNYMLAGPMRAPHIGVSQSKVIPQAAQFPALIANTKITSALILAVVVVLAVAALMKTPFGFELRIMGGSGRVARYLGIRTGRVTLLAFAISGAIGALAGVSEILGNQYFLAQNFSPGWGYTGIAVAIVAGGAAAGIAPAALFFALLAAGALQMQFADQLSPSFAIVVQAVALVVMVLALKRQSRRDRLAAAGAAAPAQPAEPPATLSTAGEQT